MKQELSLKERQELKVGEAITLTTVMAICAIAIVAVIAYRIFKSATGSTTIPGGWVFSWE